MAFFPAAKSVVARGFFEPPDDKRQRDGDADEGAGEGPVGVAEQVAVGAVGHAEPRGDGGVEVVLKEAGAAVIVVHGEKHAAYDDGECGACVKGDAAAAIVGQIFAKFCQDRGDSGEQPGGKFLEHVG